MTNGFLLLFKVCSIKLLYTFIAGAGGEVYFFFRLLITRFKFILVLFERFANTVFFWHAPSNDTLAV